MCLSNRFYNSNFVVEMDNFGSGMQKSQILLFSLQLFKNLNNRIYFIAGGESRVGMKINCRPELDCDIVCHNGPAHCVNHFCICDHKHHQQGVSTANVK